MTIKSIFYDNIPALKMLQCTEASWSAAKIADFSAQLSHIKNNV